MTVPLFELPRLFIGQLRVGSEWWHCYATSHPYYACGPLLSYAKNYRYALVNDVPPGTLARPTYYIGETARSALHETVLRGQNNPDEYGEVRLRPGQLTNRAMARLRLVREVPIIKLQSPARERLGIAKGTPLDRVLDQLERMDHYAATQQFAGLLDAQCQADANWAKALPGLMWSSRQIPSDRVAVLYAPPNEDSAWRVEEIIELETPKGLTLINEALSAGDMKLAADPRMAPPYGTEP